jgi:hypothetical protein
MVHHTMEARKVVGVFVRFCTTLGCVAIDENNMKSIVNWLDPSKTQLIMGI